MDEKDIKMIHTDNIPLLDELVYNIKMIVLTCVVKDGELAKKNETLNSTRYSNLYISAVEDRTTFGTTFYNKYLLKKIGIPETIMDKCLENRENIPQRFREPLMKISKQYLIDNYEEENNYYRMLMGYPDMDDPGIFIDDTIIDMKEYRYDKPLHLQDKDVLDYMYATGLIDELKEKFPDLKYLNYLGSKSIQPIKARTAPDFSLIYITEEANNIVSNKFKDRYEINRQFTLRTIYSEAYKFGSEYYDNFIMVLIIVQTMLDMFAEVPDYIIKRELFDMKTIQLLFESNGVDFYPDIPYRYQMSMLKNINRLIKYKSTTMNIVDICSLFGFDNIETFKYYLLKIRKKDENGEYLFDGNDNEIYDLKFMKIPVNDILDNHLHDTGSIIDYDTITTGDQYWDGEMDHEYIKSLVLKNEYNYVRTKYLSIDTVYSMTELAFQMSYFYNILFDDDKYEEMLKVAVPYIDTRMPFQITDLFCYMFALGYEYHGIKDDIMKSTSRILSIRGFNFKANMSELSEYVRNQGYTLEELGVADFQIPKGQILSFNQLLYIFTKNKEIYNHIVYQITHANNYKIYKIYYDIFEALMISEWNNDIFKKPNGEVCDTYAEFLEFRNPILYDHLIAIKKIKNRETKVQMINNHITYAVYSLQEFLDTEDLKFIFNNLPGVSSEAVKYYISEVINFFKSYKMEILSINTIYKFDDKLENRIKMIDNIVMNYVYTKADVLDLYEKLKAVIHTSPKEYMEIKEEIYKQITYWSTKFLPETIFNDEKISEMKLSLSYKDQINIADEKSLLSLLRQIDCMFLEKKQSMSLHVNLKNNERVELEDSLYKEITYWVDMFLPDDMTVKDEIIGFNVRKKMNDNLYNKEDVNFTYIKDGVNKYE